MNSEDKNYINESQTEYDFFCYSSLEKLLLKIRYLFTFSAKKKLKFRLKYFGE